MTSNIEAVLDTKDIQCQYMLTQRPSCCGWVRRKTVLQEFGAKIETRLKLGRSVSLSSKIPWQQRYMIAHGNKLYIFKDETATRAQKILTISNYCKFSEMHAEKSKDVPWPFFLKSRDTLQNKSECFSAVSQEELLKWKEAVTPHLGEEVVEVIYEEDEEEQEEEEDSDYDKPLDYPTPKSRTLPVPPRDQGGKGPSSVSTPPPATGRANRKLPPTPLEDKNGPTHRGLPPTPEEDENPKQRTLPPTLSKGKDGLQNRKVPAIPTGTQQEPDSLQYADTSISPIPPVRTQKPQAPKKPKVPLPPKAFQKKEEFPDQDTLPYELGIVEAATWRKTTEEAQAFMRQAGLPEGLYLIRQSTDGKGYTLLVRCQGCACKFKIEDDEHEVSLGSAAFNNLEELIVHYSDTSLPNKPTTLTKAHSFFVPA